MSLKPNPASRTWTIANGQTTSNAIDVRRYSQFAVQFTGAITGATCTFTSSATEAGTYTAVKDSDGNAVSIPSNAAGTITLSGAEADALAGQHWLKIVSAGAEGADRTITLKMK